MEPARASQFPHPSSETRFGRTKAGMFAGAIAALAAGAALRFWMLRQFFEISGDSRIYGGLAKNLLRHGQYSISDGSGVLHPTLIRLPGYPLFLAACFQLFGMENYFWVVVVQIVCELTGCAMLAAAAWRLSPQPWRVRAALATLWLACLCPFTAVYTVATLTETLTCFAIAMALWSVARFQDKRRWTAALGFTLAVTYAALLRPDGALVGIALALPMFAALWRGPSLHEMAKKETAKKRIAMAIVCVVIAAAPFAMWTARNWQVFHVVQPLAPRYASDPGEPTWPGWQRWVKTWCLDFVSTNQIYWNVPDGQFDLSKLPARAFDSPAQRDETAAIAQAYEDNGEDFSREIDARFAKLADQRIRSNPLRYYLWLPAGRVADMLFRPRVDNLPIDLDWWVYNHHYAETRFSWFYAALNAAYLLLALIGLCLRPRLWPWMLFYFVIRCGLLATIEAPEARYTLEFFPMIFVLGGIAIARITSGRKHFSAATD
jgi:hypothetical protein